MLLSNNQVFENNWAYVRFKGDVAPSIPFLPKVPYHYVLPSPSVQDAQLMSGVALAIDQCRRLSDIYGKRLNVMLSGGVDSQATVWAAHKSGVDFTVSIVEFANGLNIHDVQFGKDFCDAHGIHYDIIALDAPRFYISGQYLDYIEPYLCNSPQIAMHLYGIDTIQQRSDDVVILGGCPVYQQLHTKRLIGLPDFTVMAWNRFSQTKGGVTIGNFHTWSQDLFFRYLLRYRSIMSEKQSEYGLKCAVYKAEGFPIVPQPSKYTGYENVVKYFQQQYPTTMDPFNTFFRKPHQHKISVVTTAEIIGYA